MAPDNLPTHGDRINQLLPPPVTYSVRQGGHGDSRPLRPNFNDRVASVFRQILGADTRTPIANVTVHSSGSERGEYTVHSFDNNFCQSKNDVVSLLEVVSTRLDDLTGPLPSFSTGVEATAASFLIHTSHSLTTRQASVLFIARSLTANVHDRGIHGKKSKHDARMLDMMHVCNILLTLQVSLGSALSSKPSIISLAIKILAVVVSKFFCIHNARRPRQKDLLVCLLRVHMLMMIGQVIAYFAFFDTETTLNLIECSFSVSLLVIQLIISFCFMAVPSPTA